MPAIVRCARVIASLSFACIAWAAAPSPRPALAAAGACDLPVLLQPPVMLPFPAKPNRVLLADLNRDGILDLVAPTPDPTSMPASLTMTTADSLITGYSTTISIALGRGSGGVGDGTFAPPVSYTVGARPLAVVAADFDGDGILDLAVTDWASNDVAILHGNGNGTFGAPVTFPCGSRPHGIAVADFNRDGILDLVVANNGVGAVSVLLGHGSGGVGNGTFAPPVSYPVADLSVDVEAADLDGDGNIDLVATQSFQGLAVLMGHGNGTFAPARSVTAGAQPFHVTIRDLDADGVPDLLVSNSSFGGVAVLKGAGAGLFGPPAIYGGGAINAAGTVMADFDGDGIPDFAVVNTRNGLVDGAVQIFTGLATGGNPNGAFVPHSSYTLPPYPLGIAGADLNGDGRPDVVVAGYGTSVVHVLLGGCAPLPGAPHLDSVGDVPNDQGGRVFLRWTRSSFDVEGVATITGYRVWRRLPPQAAQAAARQAVAAGSSPAATIRALPRAGDPTHASLEYWEPLATLPSEQLEGYGYAAPTVQDSMPDGNPLTAFFVTALTLNPAVFYESNVDSGYSVDNLAPPTPVPFTANYTAIGNQLHWAASPASDLLAFRLFRGLTADFVPSAANLVVATRDTGCTDAPGQVYYKLAAADVHGNQSRFAMVSPELPVAVLASLASVEATADRIRLTWYAAGNAGLGATVYRRTTATDWVAMGVISADGTGYMRYVDTSVQPGMRYGYRLGIVDGGAPVYLAEVWVTAAAPAFALEGARPNPASGGALTVEFVLPSGDPARIELFDVGGRRVAAREVGSLGPGRHVVDLAAGVRIPAGIYVVRFTQGGAVKTARVAVLN